MHLFNGIPFPLGPHSQPTNWRSWRGPSRERHTRMCLQERNWLSSCPSQNPASKCGSRIGGPSGGSENPQGRTTCRRVRKETRGGARGEDGIGEGKEGSPGEVVKS